MLILGIIAVVVVGWILLRNAPRRAPGSQPRLLNEPSGDPDQPVWLEGDGSFNFPVVGESHYQDALLAICGEKTEEGHERPVTAQLVLEDDNPYDALAVAVVVDGRKVGHLSREAARALRSRLRRLKLRCRSASCKAVITGGWLREKRNRIDEGSFGVRLDLR